MADVQSAFSAPGGGGDKPPGDGRLPNTPLSKLNINSRGWLNQKRKEREALEAAERAREDALYEVPDDDPEEELARLERAAAAGVLTARGNRADTSTRAVATSPTKRAKVMNTSAGGTPKKSHKKKVVEYEPNPYLLEGQEQTYFNLDSLQNQRDDPDAKNPTGVAAHIFNSRDPVRSIEHRVPGAQLNLDSEPNYEAAVAYERGDVVEHACTGCDGRGRTHGPFRQCVVFPGFYKGKRIFDGACANCRFNGYGSRCSFHPLNQAQGLAGPQARTPTSERQRAPPASEGMVKGRSTKVLREAQRASELRSAIERGLPAPANTPYTPQHKSGGLSASAAAKKDAAASQQRGFGGGSTPSRPSKNPSASQMDDDDDDDTIDTPSKKRQSFSTRPKAKPALVMPRKYQVQKKKCLACGEEYINSHDCGFGGDDSE